MTYNEQRDTYAVNLSIKDASENPDRAALEKIVPNSNYFGVVTGVKDRVSSSVFKRVSMPKRSCIAPSTCPAD